MHKNTKKLDIAFNEIEETFGKDYANKTRELYDSANTSFSEVDDTLGRLNFNFKGEPILTLNKKFGNAKLMANTILHEVRHLRHAKKIGWKEFLNMDSTSAEIFATAPNLSTGKRLGLSSEDLQIFQDYYDYYRSE